MLSPITIVAIGKLKNASCRVLVEVYVKRLRPYTKLITIELPATSFTTAAGQTKSRELESQRIIELIDKNPNASIFVLDERGKSFTSPQLAALVGEADEPMIFIVGGTAGLTASATSHRRVRVLALSAMTLPHELARVLLLEQLYRSAMIVHGREYHY